MSASSSQGVLLKRGDGGGSEAFNLVAKITSWNTPQETNPTLDVTSVDDTSRQRISGKIKDGGKVSFEFIWDPTAAQQIGCRTDMNAGTSRNWRIDLADKGTLTTDSYWTFTAIVTSFHTKGGTGAAVTGMCEMDVTGLPVFTAAV